MTFLFTKKKNKKTVLINSVHGKEPIINDDLALNSNVSRKNVQCICCGINLHAPVDTSKIRCSVCHTTILMAMESPSKNPEVTTICDEIQLKRLINKATVSIKKGDITSREDKYSKMEPVCEYLANCFHSADILEHSFLVGNREGTINIEALQKFYQLVLSLPTRRPFFRMVCACCDLLKKPGLAMQKYRWLIIIWQNPLIRQCLIAKDQKGIDSPQLMAVVYELAKRCIGILSNITKTKHSNDFIIYLRYLPIDKFLYDVETINLYITYQLARIIHFSSRKETRVNENLTRLPTARTPSPSDEHVKCSTTGGKLGKLGDIKLKCYHYTDNWHIKTAAKLMLIYHQVNVNRGSNDANFYFSEQLTSDKFYNTMLDFIDYKQDFENWKGFEVTNRINNYIENWDMQETKKFSFCQYPFLLSLGIKISVMEFEVRRIMEYEAEQAFLTSLEKRRMVPVYCKIKIRRDNLIVDSLAAISKQQGDLRKSLRVEFANEPGIDAGGLRKEWFLLLMDSMLKSSAHLFDYIEESRMCWFTIQDNSCVKHGNLNELYYLFGVVTALAIFNGTLLNLQFPNAFYKKICNEPITFNDFRELYPDTGSNLQKLLEYSDSDLEEIFGLTFETSYKQLVKRRKKKPYKDKIEIVTRELCKNGANRKVNSSNKLEYVKLWVDFYLSKSIHHTFEQFMKGFNRVVSNCNSVKLFNSEELKRLLCGDQEESGYDFSMLRSVTKYVGYNNDSTVVNWFWNILDKWDHNLQSKLLRFVTGSDRIPATGISTLPFRITKCTSESKGKLPEAHTCFDELSLYDYNSQEELERKLYIAVTECQGFEFR